MAWCALGDSAWLFEPLSGPAAARRGAVLRMAALLEHARIPEVNDLVVAYETLAVHFDPADGAAVLDWLRTLDLPPDDSTAGNEAPSRTVEIPVAYGGEHGPDLEETARRLGRGPGEIIALHSAPVYQVAAIGFSPGFPYLSGLPEQLRIGRKAAPSPVPAGSVAIAGGQAGIYPNASPGGWWVLGRTPLPLFDPSLPAPSLLRVGDRIRFVPTDSPFPSVPPPTEISATPTGPVCEVLDPGGICTVQDLGRPGHQHAGVSPGGAADPPSAIAANLLLGNPASAALLECCLRGPRLRFSHPATVAWTGWRDGGTPVPIPAGGELDLSRPPASVRGYLAITGGILVPALLGSRATDVRARFGGHHGRPLRAGDLLPFTSSSTTIAAGPWRVGWPRPVPPGTPLEIRILPGMQAAWFAGDAFETLRHATYHTSPMSDRMGMRLLGPGLTAGAREMTSQPVVPGSIQVPPDGSPIILLAERQTLGGYPQIAHVITADLPLLARAWPGTPLRFREVTLEEARAAHSARLREFSLLRTGLRLLRS